MMNCAFPIRKVSRQMQQTSSSVSASTAEPGSHTGMLPVAIEQHKHLEQATDRRQPHLMRQPSVLRRAQRARCSLSRPCRPRSALRCTCRSAPARSPCRPEGSERLHKGAEERAPELSARHHYRRGNGQPKFTQTRRRTTHAARKLGAGCSLRWLFQPAQKELVIPSW